MKLRHVFVIASTAFLVSSCGFDSVEHDPAEEAAPAAQTASANTVTPQLAWLDQIDAVGDPSSPNPDTTEQGNAVAVDAVGNVYVVGWTSGTLPGETSARRPDAFVRKYDRNGNLIWTDQLLLGEIESATGIAVDSSGAYVTGTSLFASARLGLRVDTFVRKYSADGVELWTQRIDIGNSARVESTGIAVDATGVYVAGQVGASDRGRDEPEPWDAFVRKLRRNGDTLWTDRFGTPDNDRAQAVDTSSSGVYIAGETEGLLGESVGPAGAGIDTFVRRYNRAGAAQWTRQFDTGGDDGVSGVASVGSVVYFGGGTTGTLPGQTSAGGTDGALAKLDADGNLIWTYQFGTAAFDAFTDVDADASGVFLSGQTDGTLPGQTAFGAVDAFVQKLTPEADVAWTLQFGTAEDDVANGVAADGERVDVVGTTEGGFAGFADPDATDAFIAQIRSEETSPPVECETFEGDLIVNGPADTAQTDPFGGCFDVTGGVYVQDTSGITDLNFLSGLRSVGTFLAISDNADLRSLQGLGDLETVAIGLVIEGNASLETATAFTNLRRVDGPIHIFGNPVLAQIEMAALEHAGTLVIGGNDALVSVEMCALEFAGLLHIENNDVLESLCFDALSQVAGRFRIAYNRALPTCAAEALVQQVGPANIRGPITIVGNDDEGVCA